MIGNINPAQSEIDKVRNQPPQGKLYPHGDRLRIDYNNKIFIKNIPQDILDQRSISYHAIKLE